MQQAAAQDSGGETVRGELTASFTCAGMQQAGLNSRSPLHAWGQDIPSLPSELSAAEGGTAEGFGVAGSVLPPQISAELPAVSTTFPFPLSQVQHIAERAWRVPSDFPLLWRQPGRGQLRELCAEGANGWREREVSSPTPEGLG